MAGLAIRDSRSLDKIGITTLFDMIKTGTVTRLATAVSQLGSFLETDETSGLAESGNMTLVALLQFGFGKVSGHDLDRVPGMRLFGKFLEIIEFFVMTFGTGFGADILPRIRPPVRRQKYDNKKAVAKNAIQPLDQTECNIYHPRKRTT